MLLIFIHVELACGIRVKIPGPRPSSIYPSKIKLLSKCIQKIIKLAVETLEHRLWYYSIKTCRRLFMKSFILIVLMTSLCFGAKGKADYTKLMNKYGINPNEVSLFASLDGGDSNQIVMDTNSKIKKIPASITKLATAAAAIHHFTPGTKFKTQLLSKVKAQNSVLVGNLYFKGGGNPSFVSEDMWFLVNNFLRTGITKIDGDIIVDDTLFDQIRFDPTREDFRVDRAYDAPVGAMSFNWNSINVFVRPGADGEKARVFLDPENEYTKLVNNTKTRNGLGQNLVAERKDIKDQIIDEIEVSGTIGKDVVEHVIYKNITQPDYWSGYNLKAFLRQRGILVTGSIRTGATPEGSILLAESESKPIELIIADMNKFSNNYVSEMLCKHLSLLKTKPGNLNTGMEVIREYLKSIAVSEEQFTLINPSGFTRENKMSAYALWQILQNTKKTFRSFPELSASLPIGGVDGTLKKRFNGTQGEGWVRAKTGLLTGVASLAGFAGRRDGKIITFVFIYNGGKDGALIRNFFDEMVNSLL